MPRPRKHENANARQRAFQQRRRQAVAAARELLAKIDENKLDGGFSVSEALEQMSDEQRASLRLLIANSEQGKNLDQKAG